MMELTAFDKALLNLLQTELPVCSHPFAQLGVELGTDEATVLAHLKHLKAEGYLRRIGTFFNSSRLGYEGTLVALEVEEDQMASVAEAVNRYPGATHNYEREGQYNLWFTLLTPDPKIERKILREVRALPGVRAMMNLKAHKKYKINVQFHLK
jgi:DNA-binding Lrp family transcriptional regulator